MRNIPMKADDFHARCKDSIPAAYSIHGDIFYSLYQIPIFTFPNYIHVGADHVQFGEYIIPYYRMIKATFNRLKEWFSAWIDVAILTGNKEWIWTIIDTIHVRFTEFMKKTKS